MTEKMHTLSRSRSNSMTETELEELTNTSSETYEFKAEITQLMNLIINTFYSNKDIFLRELISNSSDALNKVRHAMLNNGKTINEQNMKIRIIPNELNNTICIEDNGIGMNKKDLNDNLGTIANSGTKQFIDSLKTMNSNPDSHANDLIGQFGVGFYASFLVADQVNVLTRKYGENETWLWQSTANGSYKIIQMPNDEMEHGTKIILQIKKEQTNYVEQFKLRDIIKEHSQFVDYPIELLITTLKPQQKQDENEEIPDDLVVQTWEIMNRDKPLWCRNPSDITFSEYNSLYKNITSDCLDFMFNKNPDNKD